MIDLRELDIRHLIALDAVVTEGTFGRAATALGYTQSAVSQQIAALERLIGTSLFDRPGGPRPAALTPLGEFLLPRARLLLAEVDALGNDLALVRDGRAGSLTIGTFQSVASVLLPPVIAAVRRDFPDVAITFLTLDDDEELLDALDHRTADLCFVGRHQRAGIVAEPMVSDPWVLLAEPGRFAAGPVEPSALAGEPLIGLGLDAYQRALEANLRQVGLLPNIVFRSNDNGTVESMVRAGVGSAVVPLLVVDLDDDRLSIHPLAPKIADRETLLAWSSERTLPPIADAVIKQSRAVAAKLAAALEAWST